MRKPDPYALTLTAILAVALLAIVGASAGASTADVCPGTHLATGETVAGAHGTIEAGAGGVSYDLNEGWTATICVKAGSAKSGGGTHIETVTGTGSIAAPGGHDLSHWSLTLEYTPPASTTDPTTTTTEPESSTTTTTSTPPPTTTPPTTTTTTPPTTTTTTPPPPTSPTTSSSTSTTAPATSTTATPPDTTDSESDEPPTELPRTGASTAALAAAAAALLVAGGTTVIATRQND